MDCSPPSFSVHGILQARILEWVAIPFSRGSSQPRGRTLVSCIGRWVLYRWATREVQKGREGAILLEGSVKGKKKNNLKPGERQNGDCLNLWSQVRVCLSRSKFLLLVNLPSSGTMGSVTWLAQYVWLTDHNGWSSGRFTSAWWGNMTL